MLKRVILIGIILLAVLLAACDDSPNINFGITSLEITPNKVTVNQQSKVTAKIVNNSSNKAEYTVPLMVNGVADDRKTLILAAGATEAVEFTVSRDAPGQYKVSIGARSSLLFVEPVKPPSLSLSELKLNVSEVNPGDDVIISASLKNTGGSKGSYIARWQIDGAVEKTEEVILMPGTSYTFILKITKTVPGTYSVKIDNLEGKFTVLQPVVPIQITDPTVCPPDMKYDKTRKC